MYPLAKIEGAYIQLCTCMLAVGINTELLIIAGLIVGSWGGGRWSQTLIHFSDVLPSCMLGGWWDMVNDKRKFEIKVYILLRGLSRNFQRREDLLHGKQLRMYGGPNILRVCILVVTS